ncbi:hypothetical protein MMPV_001467 [Pyropia vietnamensis]
MALCGRPLPAAGLYRHFALAAAAPLALLFTFSDAATSAAVAVPTAASPPSTAAPWTWTFLGGNLSSAMADAQNDGSVNSIDEVTGWAAPSGVYSLLAANDQAVTTFYRFDGSGGSGGVVTGGAGAGWTLLKSFNESGPAAAIAAARGTVGVRGDAGVVPPVVWGGIATADTDGALGGRLWLYGGVVAVSPFDVSTYLYEYDPATGSWARLSGGQGDRLTACDHMAGSAPCPEDGNSRRRTQALLVAPAERALYLLPRPARSVPAEPQQVWRFDLDAGSWRRLTPSTTGPTFGATMNGFSAAMRGDTLTLVVSSTFGRPASVWRLSGLGGDSGAPAPAWSLDPSPPTGVTLAVNQYGTWTDGRRFLLNYIPGSLPVELDGVDISAVPGLTVLPTPPTPSFVGPRLTDIDRFYVYDTATGRGRAFEAPTLALNEQGVNAGPRQPPPEGARVAAGDAPLRRYAPVTGGTLVRGEGECAESATLTGYLQGGLINGWQQVGLLRFALREAVLLDAFGPAPSSPPPSPSPSPPSPSPSPSPSPAGGVALWGQCGGREYEGPTACAVGLVCDRRDDYYSQCRPPPTRPGQVGPWERCGGRGYPPRASTTCVDGFVCRRLSEWFSQCEPAV